MDEAVVYAQIARTDFPDDYAETVELFGLAGARVAGEMAFIKMHGIVPDWAQHIAAFEIVGDRYVFIHRRRRWACFAGIARASNRLQPLTSALEVGMRLLPLIERMSDTLRG